MTYDAVEFDEKGNFIKTHIEDTTIARARICAGAIAVTYKRQNRPCCMIAVYPHNAKHEYSGITPEVWSPSGRLFTTKGFGN